MDWCISFIVLQNRNIKRVVIALGFVENVGHQLVIITCVMEDCFASRELTEARIFEDLCWNNFVLAHLFDVFG